MTKIQQAIVYYENNPYTINLVKTKPLWKVFNEFFIDMEIDPLQYEIFYNEKLIRLTDNRELAIILRGCENTQKVPIFNLRKKLLFFKDYNTNFVYTENDNITNKITVEITNYTSYNDVNNILNSFYNYKSITNKSEIIVDNISRIKIYFDSLVTANDFISYISYLKSIYKEYENMKTKIVRRNTTIKLKKIIKRPNNLSNDRINGSSIRNSYKNIFLKNKYKIKVIDKEAYKNKFKIPSFIRNDKKLNEVKFSINKNNNAQRNLYDSKSNSCNASNILYHYLKDDNKINEVKNNIKENCNNEYTKVNTNKNRNNSELKIISQVLPSEKNIKVLSVNVKNNNDENMPNGSPPIFITGNNEVFPIIYRYNNYNYGYNYPNMNYNNFNYGNFNYVNYNNYYNYYNTNNYNNMLKKNFYRNKSSDSVNNQKIILKNYSVINNEGKPKDKRDLTPRNYSERKIKNFK